MDWSSQDLEETLSSRVQLHEVAGMVAALGEVVDVVIKDGRDVGGCALQEDSRLNEGCWTVADRKSVV